MQRGYVLFIKQKKHALAPFGASAIVRPCAQLLWCELYDMKDKKKALTLFSSGKPFREKNLSIPAADASSPSMPLTSSGHC